MPMKVGVFLANISPDTGGVFTFENEMFQALTQLADESGHTFVVFSWTKDLEKSAKHIQVIPIQRGFAERVISRFYRTSIRVIRRIRYLKGASMEESFYERIARKSGVELIWYIGHYCDTMEIPYILTYYDLQHRLQPYFPEVSAKGIWDGREKRLAVALRRASVIIAGTEAGKAEIEQFYQVPAERIKVLPLPTPQFALTALPGSAKQELAGYCIPENYLFYPAQFWAHKNHAGLLQAVQLLRDKWKMFFPVVFVGSDKGNKQYIQKLVAKFNLTTQVHFLGFVPRQDLISLYQNAFALAFPTFFGPDNLPPLEAFALGCPVVASNVPGAQEQLGEAALLVDPKSPEQIALAIKSLYDDPGLRQTLVQRGLERAARWTGRDYVLGVFSILDKFEPIRRCWDK